jgi:hypothetical protein
MKHHRLLLRVLRLAPEFGERGAALDEAVAEQEVPDLAEPDAPAHPAVPPHGVALFGIRVE